MFPNISFLFKDVAFISPLLINGWISGLDIINKSRDYQTSAYEIIDVRPAILKKIECKNYRKSPSLSKIAENLGIKITVEHHNALNDAILLCKICKKINIKPE